MTFTPSSSAGPVRPPAVAGRFYPGDARDLGGAVDALLAGARARAVPGLRALIAPHAGYVYSGPVAASAYAALAAMDPKPTRVVLLGPAHHAPVRGLALPGAAGLRTPLGVVPVDEAGAAVAARLGGVTTDANAHQREHSLEVHLPFLQRVLGDFTVVPLVVGAARPSEVASVIEALWDDADTVVVVSSDLSHYLPYEAARAVDADTARKVVALDVEGIEPDEACGAAPVRGLLEAARRRGMKAHLLDLRNSGDTEGDRDRVVGYGSFAVTGDA